MNDESLEQFKEITKINTKTLQALVFHILNLEKLIIELKDNLSLKAQIKEVQND